ncbi:uncharacterized protein VDAG_02306 [Verticillium dahliae VdLs.17]|uniref:Uncharacterized protein n=1 Tax=Verticillium dahliae (strain VdLs.17 / ATCC MYA-4575 / FGSC 10137) TaxID=498257 RepID=G2WVG5_VERDV|nr:uncharacterized protein VDAG_02306 [Verticillium dahliae VdLs.17]EGY20290.1 hypothetical protein VDAG_02306 [Verticillium dahliae VdLs.17]
MYSWVPRLSHTRLPASHTDDLPFTTSISSSSSTAHPITITIVIVIAIAIAIAIVISSPSLATKARIRFLMCSTSAALHFEPPARWQDGDGKLDSHGQHGLQ